MTTTAPSATATHLADLTWVEFTSRAKVTPYWILTAGSVEQHGPHLPLGADTLVVDKLASLTAAAHHSIILGRVSVGVLHGFQDWPGSQRVSNDVLVAQVCSMAQPAVKHGNRLMVLNGHDENHEPLLLAGRQLNEQYGTDVVIVEWAQLVTDVIKEVSSSTTESHAGEGLTSVFLHWYPERVRTELIQAGTAPAGDLTRDDLHVAKRAHHVSRFSSEDVPTGVLGDPRRASAEKGRHITDSLVSRVDDLVRERGWL